MTDWPKIKSRRTIDISPWMKIIEREVEFAEGAKPEIYHAVGQQDYIAILARTPDGLIPIVRQYRPAVEGMTWELPAGMVDPGEDAAETCRRELLEETALPARAVHALGSYAACTARLSNRAHSFFVETGPRVADRAVRPASRSAGDAAGTGGFDSRRHFHAAIAHRHPGTRRPARLSTSPPSVPCRRRPALNSGVPPAI